MKVSTQAQPLLRARVYKGLATLFGAPSEETLSALAQDWRLVVGALKGLGAPEAALQAAHRIEALLGEAPAVLQDAHAALFDPSGGLACPPTETSHTSYTPAHGLTRGAEVADVAGFYRAFGLEVLPGTERADHLTAELSFLQLVALKEAVASEDDEEEGATICREATQAFLRDHLAAWVPDFAAMLGAAAPPAFYREAGALLDSFVAWDAETLDATPSPR